MTVQATTRRAGPTIGNSLATNFPFAFKVFVGSDLQVVLTTLATGVQSVLVLNDPAGYTVALNVDQNANPGGTVVYNPSGVPLPATQSLTITSVVPQVQGTHIVNGGAFFANNIEDAVDKVLINLQDLALSVGNAVRFPASDSAVLNAILPPAALRANQALLFDLSGNVVVGAVSNAPIAAAWQPVVAAPSLAAGRAAMGFSAYFDTLISAATRAAFDALITPLTTKGDLWVFAAADQRKAVGADGFGLVADSGQADGLKWASVFNDSGFPNIVAAATTPIFASTTTTVTITGTADISAFDAAPSGRVRLVRVNGSGGMLLLSAGNIGGLPATLGDIQMLAGDFFIVIGTPSTPRILSYQRTNGQQLMQGRLPFGLLQFGALNLPASATNFCHRGVGITTTATEANATYVVGEACTISELRIVANAALAGGSAVFTLRKNGADTTLVATLAAASGTTASDTTHSVDFSEGDLISLKAVTGAIGATTDFGMSMVVKKKGVANVGVPTQFWCAASTNSMAAAGVGTAHTYSMAGGEPVLDFQPGPCRIATKAPYSGTFVAAGTVAGPTVRKNDAYPSGVAGANVPQLLITGANLQMGSGARGALLAFAEGDLFNVTSQVNMDSDATFLRWSYDCLGPSELQYPPSLMNFQSGNQLQATTRFAGAFACSGGGAVGTWQSAAENEVQVPMPVCTLRNLRVTSDAAVAAGQSTVVTLRKNGVNTGVTCTLTSAGRLASDLVNSVAFAAGDLLSVQVAASATATTRTYQVTVEVNLL